jgi:hypothetical protein
MVIKISGQALIFKRSPQVCIMHMFLPVSQSCLKIKQKKWNQHAFNELKPMMVPELHKHYTDKKSKTKTPVLCRGLSFYVSLIHF